MWLLVCVLPLRCACHIHLHEDAEVRQHDQGFFMLYRNNNHIHHQQCNQEVNGVDHQIT